MNLAAIDLGTNSCRLMIADEKGNVLFRKTTTTKLGEGLHACGGFTSAAFERGLKCLNEYANIMKEYAVADYKAIATASCRMANNGAEFVKAVEELTGIHMNIIDGREEAFLNVKGAATNAAADCKYILVYDLGGGSTEITLATNNVDAEIIYTISIPWGARNAAEAFDLLEYDEVKASELSNEIKKYTSDFMQNSGFVNYREQTSCVATSSTPLRLVSMIRETGTYERTQADGIRDDIKCFDETINHIRKMNFIEMSESPYIGENRAVIFQAACVIFKTIYDELGIKSLTASLKGAQEAIIDELVRKWQN